MSRSWPSRTPKSTPSTVFLTPVQAVSQSIAAFTDPTRPAATAVSGEMIPPNDIPIAAAVSATERCDFAAVSAALPTVAIPAADRAAAAPIAVDAVAACLVAVAYRPAAAVACVSSAPTVAPVRVCPIRAVAAEAWVAARVSRSAAAAACVRLGVSWSLAERVTLTGRSTTQRLQFRACRFRRAGTRARRGKGQRGTSTTSDATSLRGTVSRPAHADRTHGNDAEAATSTASATPYRS